MVPGLGSANSGAGRPALFIGFIGPSRQPQCDPDRVVHLFEASSPANVKVYQGHGFAVRGHHANGIIIIPLFDAGLDVTLQRAWITGLRGKRAATNCRVSCRSELASLNPETWSQTSADRFATRLRSLRPAERPGARPKRGSASRTISAAIQFLVLPVPENRP